MFRTGMSIVLAVVATVGGCKYTNHASYAKTLTKTSVEVIASGREVVLPSDAGQLAIELIVDSSEPYEADPSMFAGPNLPPSVYRLVFVFESGHMWEWEVTGDGGLIYQVETGETRIMSTKAKAKSLLTIMDKGVKAPS